MKLTGLKWVGAMLLAASSIRCASAGVITNPTSVVISLSSTLNQTLLDPTLVYEYFDGTTAHVSALSLGSGIPSGSQGPFLETINTPAGFVSGSATIFGLYSPPINPGDGANPGGCSPIPCGVGIVFNSAAGSTAETGLESYATAFSGGPAESSVAIAILAGAAGFTALEGFFGTPAYSADWVPFTLGQSSATVDLVLFSASINGGTVTVNSVTSGVPEPGSLLLLAAGMAAIAVKRRLTQ